MGQRAMMALELKAVRERWDIPEQTRDEIIARMSDIVNTSKSKRNQIMAARVLATFDQINVMDKKVGQDVAPQQHIHLHSVSEPNPKVIDAQANLVAALSEAKKMPQATKVSEIVGELADGN